MENVVGIFKEKRNAVSAIEKLRAAARLSSPEIHDVKNASVTLQIPWQGMVLFEVKPVR